LRPQRREAVVTGEVTPCVSAHLDDVIARAASCLGGGA
jgi:hypothetical protein